MTARAFDPVSNLWLNKREIPTSFGKWTRARKALVLSAIEEGVFTEDEAVSQYHLSHEEIAEWRRGYERDGVDGLRALARDYERSSS